MRVDAFELWCYRILLRVSCMSGEENEQFKLVLERIGFVLMLRKS